MIAADTVIAQPQWVFAAVVDGEHLLLHKQTSLCFRLSAIGAEIWQQLSEPKTLDVLLSELMAIYDVAREVCEPDVQEFLMQLHQRDLLQCLEAEV